MVPFLYDESKTSDGVRNSLLMYSSFADDHKSSYAYDYFRRPSTVCLSL